MDWNNLRYFLELARTGTLVNAARRLEVDHTTVARRLQALEKEVGTPLFAREAGGHRLTEAGRQLLPQVEAMEAAVAQIVVRQIPDEVHRALKAQAAAHGRSAEAELREIIARAVLREGRPRAGDLMRGIWSGAAMDGFSVERDRTPVEPACFE